MPNYFVTYGAMDGDAGANLLWHAFILLSKYDPQTQQMEVVDNWGFYGVPTTDKNPITRGIKKYLRVDTDFTGNHGILQHEDVRSLDLGKGLNGVTFELTEKKFNELYNKCHKIDHDQFEAIDEVVAQNGLQNCAKEKHRNYAFEHLSQLIYKIECLKADLEQREPRLKYFRVLCGGSRNCKMQVLELLQGILTPAQVARVRGWSAKVPRWSGRMEKIYLYSTGPLHEHRKRSGDVIRFRDAKQDKDQVKLFWTLPPQELETQYGETRRFLKLSDEYCYQAKQVVAQLQQLEWFFINVTLDDKYTDLKKKLIYRIHESYEAFSKVDPSCVYTNDNSWSASFLSLLSIPRDEHEKLLAQKIHQAKMLMLGLYSAVVDRWETDMDILQEDIEGLAALLPVDKQKELCDILGRTYLEPEFEPEQKIAL